MNEKPRIYFKQPDYTHEIDEIFENIGVKDIIVLNETINTVDDMKQLMLAHPQCNTILGLLKEFYELSFRLDHMADWKMKSISQLLIQLDSPVILYRGE